MATAVQIVFDTRDPDLLASFWAAALHYRLEDPPAGYASWESFLRTLGVPEEEWNSASAVVDPAGVGPRLFFQRLDTPKPAKNRLHLDLNTGGGGQVPLEERKKRIRAEVERLLGLGATRQREWEEADEYWIVMQDPDGNEFCIQ